MNAPNSKPLDLAQFADDALHTPMGAPLDPQQVAPALLAECRRQREQINALREALDCIATGRTKDWLRDHGKELAGNFNDRINVIARAALEATAK